MTEQPPVDVLAIAPHPDDAEIGCGGLLLLAHQRGLRTAVVDLSDGECATLGTPAVRAREKGEAAALLGLSHRESLGLPDTRIGRSPDHELALLACLRRLRPRLVLAPLRGDRHPDHHEASTLVERARRLAAVARVGDGQPHTVERVLHYAIHTPMDPGAATVIFDITSVWPQRMAALAAYQSQFAEPDNSSSTPLSGEDFMRALEARAIYFGAMVGARYGEPYRPDGPLRMVDPLAVLGPPPTSRYRST